MDHPSLTIDQKIQLMELASKTGLTLGMASASVADTIKNYNAMVEAIVKSA